MGKQIAGLASEYNFSLVKQLGKSENENAAGINSEIASAADVIIEFSSPDAALKNCLKAISCGIPVVCGTTGWLTPEALETVNNAVKKNSGKIVYGSNFSLGVQLFMRLVQQAGALLNEVPNADAALHEVHHTSKADAPSGTALTAAKLYMDAAGIPAEKLTYGIPKTGKPAADAFYVTSQRVGSVFGEHALRLHTPFDDIEISHKALSRDGFASGALKTAKWLVSDSTPPGFYMIEDIFETVLKS